MDNSSLRENLEKSLQGNLSLGVTDVRKMTKGWLSVKVKSPVRRQELVLK